MWVAKRKSMEDENPTKKVTIICIENVLTEPAVDVCFLALDASTMPGQLKHPS
jgi:hypothetical protein